VFFRVYGKYFNRDDSVLPNGDEAGDQFQMGQGGFRMDLEPSTTISSRSKETPTTARLPNQRDELALTGGNVVGRWTHTFSDDSDLQIQTYYDRTDRDVPPIL